VRVESKRIFIATLDRWDSSLFVRHYFVKVVTQIFEGVVQVVHYYG